MAYRPKAMKGELARMKSEIYQEAYRHILNDAQRIRKEIMNEWGDILMFGGTIPEEAMNELSTAARITGLAFDALSTHGIKCAPVDGKPDLFRLTVGEESYVCHKTAIPSMSGFLDVVNIPGVTPVSIGQEQKSSDIVSEDIDVGIESEPDEESQIHNETSNNEFCEEVTDDAVVEKQDVAEEDITDLDINGTEMASDDETATEEGFDIKKETEDNAPAIGSYLKSDFFAEEKTKFFDEIVYEMFDASMTHSGYAGGGKGLDIQVMIAPLKISKFSCPSVPILVSVYCNGKIYTASSYDQAEEGKNLVTLNVEEFYLLFRGSYDGSGKFHAFITTTGISASQGDILNITSESRHGDQAGRNVNNGHVKFRTTVYDDPGTLEAFPFGEPENNEFIVMTKTDEFVDYLFISDEAGGLKKPIMFQNGKKLQVECGWDTENRMFVNLKEV